jgi:hypothetical protein
LWLVVTFEHIEDIVLEYENALVFVLLLNLECDVLFHVLIVRFVDVT